VRASAFCFNTIRDVIGSERRSLECIPGRLGSPKVTEYDWKMPGLPWSNKLKLIAIPTITHAQYGQRTDFL
jgi:hypothetical protein